MKATFKKATCVLLSVLMLLSVLTAGITVSAEGEPEYTDDKMTVITTAYGGCNNPATDNTYGLSSTVHYTWTETDVYVRWNIQDPDKATMWDMFYALSDIKDDNDYPWNSTNGGYIQHTVADGTIASGGSLAIEVLSNTATANGRVLEIKFPRTAGATGFSISPTLYVAELHAVSYHTSYNVNSGMKRVLFEDNSTWLDKTANPALVEPDPDEPEIPIDIEIGTEKGERYTDSKLTTISSAYAGPGGGQINNTNGLYSKNWYDWDEEYVYYYSAIFDPTQSARLDIFYMISNIDTEDLVSYAFSHANGAYYQYTVATGDASSSGALNPEVVSSKVTEYGRDYEFKFKRTEGAKGFSIAPVIFVSDACVISYTDQYLRPAGSKHVYYEDESSWLDESASNAPTPYIAAVEELIAAIPAIEELTYEHSGVVEQANTAYRSLPRGWNWDELIDPDLLAHLQNANDKMKALFFDTVWVDGEKDDLYTDDKMTIISTSYAGSGGFETDNLDGLYTKSWYTWDDDYVYVFVDVYDPNSLSQMDVLYLIGEHSSDATNSFEHSAGTYLQYNVPNGSFDGDSGALEIEYAYKVTETGRTYEVRFSRFSNDGFSFSPVIWVNAQYAVARHTNYYVSANLKQVFYDDEASWFDDTMTDGYTVHDPKRITDIEEVLALIPEDVNSLTLETRGVVDDALRAYNTLPAGWRRAVNAELVAHMEAAQAVIAGLELQLTIEALVADIAALPADITLEQSDAVNALLGRYNDLPEEAKQQVSNVALLNDALAKLDALQAGIVADMIAALDMENLTDEVVEAARVAFDALSDAQKALVSQELRDKLDAAQKALDVQCGDVNGDSKVDASDALMALQHSVQLITLNAEQITAADTNLDDKVDATDALQILQYSVHLIDSLPRK